jgi:assimilatory nitrate reductase catalytic subunit
MESVPVNPSTRTTCPYCGVGCGVIATPEPEGVVAIKGDAEHPANFGRLCSKGTALGETLSLDDRLLYPEISGARAHWDAALDLVASTFSQTIAEHGSDSVALYVSGQLLTEDYYVANKLMKGFIGSANIDTNSRLCMASSVAGHRRAFGTDTVPGHYGDLEEADVVVLVGSNLAWCHPVVFQRLLAAREARGTRIVVIDPRQTVTAEIADLHLAIAPDQDVPLFLGLLTHLVDQGLANKAYLDAYVGDQAPALAVARSYDVAKTAHETGLSIDEITRFFGLFAGNERVVTVYSQGVNQSVCGSDKVNAIINCHLLTGRIGRPGMGPFSITGQPNAMGGREVGGLANMLAAHMNIEDAEARARVQRFWASPSMAQKPGLKAVEMFDAVRSGKIKAIWVMATNPVDSMPDADAVKAALALCPFVVVSDVVRETDTTRFAHVLLPAAAWGEKDGTVTNSERRISRQRQFLPLPGEAKPDWWAINQVAQRMGFSGFAHGHVSEIFAEHAALSGFENNDSRDFDISAYRAITVPEFNALKPFQWPQASGQTPCETRFFANGNFYTPDRKARMIATPPRPSLKETNAEFPLVLNTGRIRDQWHTMTRTAKSARLMGQFGEPFCEIHPDDAAAAGIAPACLALVRTQYGSTILRALISPRQRRGSVFVPMHWTDRFTGNGRINVMTSPLTDPVSGQPGLKSEPVAIKPFVARWYGYAVSAAQPEPVDVGYWAIAKAEQGYRIELAGDEPVADWQDFAAKLLGASEGAEWAVFHDARAGQVRLAAFEGETLIGALFVGSEPVALSRSFVVDALSEDHAGSNRLKLLAGRGGADRPDPGSIVCACFSVGINQIVAAMHGGATSVDAIGEALKAGSNCGSCRSEIRRIVDETRLKTAV